MSYTMTLAAGCRRTCGSLPQIGQTAAICGRLPQASSVTIDIYEETMALLLLLSKTVAKGLEYYYDFSALGRDRSFLALTFLLLLLLLRVSVTSQPIRSLAAGTELLLDVVAEHFQRIQ